MRKPALALGQEPLAPSGSHFHRFRRLYLGPSPASSSKAAAAALAIAQDAAVTQPAGLLVFGGREGFVVRPPSDDEDDDVEDQDQDEDDVEVEQVEDRSDKSGMAEHGQGVAKASEIEAAHVDGNVRTFGETVPSDAQGEHLGDTQHLTSARLGPAATVGPPRPRRVGRDASEASFVSHVSFASAQSVPGGTRDERVPRRPKRQARHNMVGDALAAERSTRPPLVGHHLNVVAEGGTEKSHNGKAALREAHTLFSDDANISPAGANGLDAGHVRQGTDPPEPSLIGGTPPRLGDSAAPGRHRLDQTSPVSRGPRRRHHGSSQGLRPPAVASRRHPREFSRQSRMSRASTAGTLGSFGTRATDASFGGAGGFRARLARLFGVNAGLQNAGYRSHRRHATDDVASVGSRGGLQGFRHRTSVSAGPESVVSGDGTRRRRLPVHGVFPGAIGTSGGGTKWVGLSFEVGQRIRDVVEHGRVILEHTEAGDVALAADNAAGGAVEADEDGTPDRAPQLERSGINPSGREAKTSLARARVDVPIIVEPEAVERRSPRGRDQNAEIREDPQTDTEAARNVNAEHSPRAMDQGPGRAARPEPTLGHAMPSHANGEADIESRHGWSDVVSFMSAESKVSGAQAGTLSLRGSMAQHGKRVVGELSQGWDDIRARKGFAPTIPPTLDRAEPSFEPPSDRLVESVEKKHERYDVRQSTLGAGRQPASPDGLHESALGDGSGSRRGDTPGQAAMHFGPTQHAVKFEPHHKETSLRARAAMTDVPASPHEVLSRPGSPSQGKSLDRSGDAADSAPGRGKERLGPRSVIKRGRVLVKVGWTPTPEITEVLDQASSRKYVIYAEEWREFMAVLRMGRLELWDHAGPLSKLLGHPDHLKLKYVVPLRDRSTRLSAFSHIDHIFCVTFSQEAAISSSRVPIHFRRGGTNIFLFNARTRTASDDWAWQVWIDMGGKLPDEFDLHIPMLDVRLRVPLINRDDDDEARSEATHSLANQVVASSEGGKSNMMDCEQVLAAIAELAKSRPDWGELFAHLSHEGAKLGLAWRLGSRLEWVVHEECADGAPRDWVVAVGNLLRQERIPHALELRPALHYPTSVKAAKRNVTWDEPPAVEGFLWRVKPVSGALTRLYASTHDGHIFVCRPNRAFAPERHLALSHEKARYINPGRPQAHPSAQRRSEPRRAAPAIDEIRHVEDLEEKLLQFERRDRLRLNRQIVAADGYCDLRDIQVVRCVEGGVSFRPGEDDERIMEARRASDSEQTEGAPFEAAESASDDDIGGEEGIAVARDRASLHRRRQFEVVMSNGRATRFEAYSKSIASDWVYRLAQLSTYWKRRERVDALEVMNVSGYDPVWLHRKWRGATSDLDGIQQEHSLEPDLRLDNVGPALGNVWNWCTVLGCRGIVRSGRLYQKRKAFSAFSSRHCILVAGRLLTYRLVTSQSTARNRQNAGIFHRRQDAGMPLLDAYVYSGKLTEEMLINGRSEGPSALGGAGGSNAGNFADRRRIPRVYRDGLLSIDDDEDCTFVLCYRSSSSSGGGERPPSVPALGEGGYSQVALRARSKLERDLWVHAISMEVERLARATCEREKLLHDTGLTPYQIQRH